MISLNEVCFCSSPSHLCHTPCSTGLLLEHPPLFLFVSHMSRTPSSANITTYDVAYRVFCVPLRSLCVL